MKPLPATNLRTNIGTWAVPISQLPAVAHFLHDVLPNEVYDPHFHGQHLETTYFDAPSLALRKARRKGQRYLTLRIRCYQPHDGEELYALSAKTESEKWRQEISSAVADDILAGNRPNWTAELLPARIAARLDELTEGEPVCGAVMVCCRRYAVEDSTDRYTLDVEVRTDTGKGFPYAVLEQKSLDAQATPPAALRALQLRPLKLSKFLWSTSP
jgi:hypothetical protein